MEDVDQVEFVYNLITHLATKELPLVVAYGVESLQHANLVLERAYFTLKFKQYIKKLVKNKYWR
jgi:hypothetical protein